MACRGDALSLACSAPRFTIMEKSSNQNSQSESAQGGGRGGGRPSSPIKFSVTPARCTNQKKKCAAIRTALLSRGRWHDRHAREASLQGALHRGRQLPLHRGQPASNGTSEDRR